MGLQGQLLLIGCVTGYIRLKESYMTDVRIAGLSKRIGESLILSDVNLVIAEGEYVVVVGPSGCGKSTLLRAVAGLEDVSEGRISLGGHDITNLPPAERGVAMVFQSYALYPNMTVRENLGFALRMAKRSAAEISSAVEKAAQILDIQHLLDRKPAALSGGQRQRVAIGRAIVRQPDLFLFDEPLSNLDTELRVKMRHEFLRLHKALKTTTLYVTHDQTEAMTLADRIVVLRSGRIEQVGTPDELYQRPTNQFVAGFIGSPQMNFVPATVRAVTDSQLTLTLSQGDLVSIPFKSQSANIAAGDEIILGVRPDDLVPSASGSFVATVDFTERMGGQSLIHLKGPDQADLLWQVQGDVPQPDGAVIRFDLARSLALHFFNAEGKRVGSST
jgi:multiple sugar transport system ATP-binding protein